MNLVQQHYEGRRLNACPLQSAYRHTPNLRYTAKSRTKRVQKLDAPKQDEGRKHGTIRLNLDLFLRGTAALGVFSRI